MSARRTSVLCTIIALCSILLASCTTSPSPKATSVNRPHNTPAASTPTASTTLTSTKAPQMKTYTSHVLLKGGARPDDLTFDLQGNLLFSDANDGTISRLNSNGSVTVLLHGLGSPEGLTILPNGAIVFGEQNFNRIDELDPGATTFKVIRNLPGKPSTAKCKDGVDGIAYDSITKTLIVPDSPIGQVYRLSLDGQSLTLLAGGIVRPVGAWVDSKDNIFIADECGGAVWRIAPGGATTRFGGFGMPDDVTFDSQGNMLVIDLAPSIHALIRMNMTTMQHEILAQQGFIEPQGLIVDKNDDIFVSDDFADTIVEFTPV